MPGKLIPGEKKTPIYKKSSGFKMKSPLKHPHRTWKEANTHDHNYLNYKNLDTQGKKFKKPKAKVVKPSKKSSKAKDVKEEKK